MIEPFYEKYIKDENIIKKGIEDGRFVQGTLYFDKNLANKWDGYVDVPGIPQAVKVRGLKYLNKALHLDTVVLKMVNWVIWEKAQAKLVADIDFTEKANDDPYQNKGTSKVIQEEDVEEDQEDEVQTDTNETRNDDEESKADQTSIE